ncbi:hypothetical protein [Streptomyces sp. NPDC002265]|uniref:hypothetical protein n=1 Tax=Streptomyces sp. NPDC002265 TaxID=3154415 RepID=UPI00332B264C
MTEPGGVPARAILMCTVVVGLGLVASIVTSETRTATATVTYAVPDAEPSATVRTSVRLDRLYTCRCDPGSTQ